MYIRSTELHVTILAPRITRWCVDFFLIVHHCYVYVWDNFKNTFRSHWCRINGILLYMFSRSTLKFKLTKHRKGIKDLLFVVYEVQWRKLCSERDNEVDWFLVCGGGIETFQSCGKFKVFGVYIRNWNICHGAKGHVMPGPLIQLLWRNLMWD